jgi:GDP-4-dehydro-6-deoxy-D-mannose reductase
MAETLAGSFDGLQITSTRAFNHTGPHQTTAFAVPAFASQIARIEAGHEEPIVRVGNLDALRDFLDVRDVVRAYRLLLTAETESAYRVVNVASGTGVAMRDLLNRLLALARVPVTVETDPSRLRPSDIPESIGDPALLTEWTGWKPEVDLDTTLAATLEWWRQITPAFSTPAAA